jgi:hypothetical protein
LSLPAVIGIACKQRPIQSSDHFGGPRRPTLLERRGLACCKAPRGDLVEGSPVAIEDGVGAGEPRRLFLIVAVNHTRAKMAFNYL